MNRAFRTNKKELLLSFSFILIGAVLLKMFFYIGESVYIPNRKKEYVDNLLKNNKKVNFLIIGSSHAGAINQRYIQDHGQGYYLMTGATDMFETGYIVKTMLPHLPNLKTVFISVSYFSFYFDNAVSRTYKGKRRNLYYYYPFSWRIISGDLPYLIQGVLSSLITVDHWEKCWNQLWGIKDAVVKHPEADIKKCGSALALDNHASRRCVSIVREMKDINKRHENIFKDSYEATKDFVQILLNYGIRTIFFTPPYWHTFNEKFPQKYKTSMSYAMRKLVQQYPIEFYDFSHDPSFCFQPDYFFNSDHFNDNGDGEKLFSEKLGAVTRQNLDKRHVFQIF